MRKEDDPPIQVVELLPDCFSVFNSPPYDQGRDHTIHICPEGVGVKCDRGRKSLQSTVIGEPKHQELRSMSSSLDTPLVRARSGAWGDRTSAHTALKSHDRSHRSLSSFSG